MLLLLSRERRSSGLKEGVVGSATRGWRQFGRAG